MMRLAMRISFLALVIAAVVASSAQFPSVAWAGPVAAIQRQGLPAALARH